MKRPDLSEKLFAREKMRKQEERRSFNKKTPAKRKRY